jgi:hypothetical protein
MKSSECCPSLRLSRSRLNSRGLRSSSEVIVVPYCFIVSVIRVSWCLTVAVVFDVKMDSE